jgi:probable rRNA maturation factor
VTVALVADARVRALNRRYRRIDRVTDVLSFAMTPAAPGSQEPRREPAGAGGARRAVTPAAGRAGPVWLGDVVIAVGAARRQARAAGHGLTEELRVLALHGLLHLLGYDHERDGGRMARLERRLRRRGGLGPGLIERTS